MYVTLNLYAASIDVNDTSLYIPFASAFSTGDRKHTTLVFFNTTDKIIIYLAICKDDENHGPRTCGVVGIIINVCDVSRLSTLSLVVPEYEPIVLYP